MGGSGSGSGTPDHGMLVTVSFSFLFLGEYHSPSREILVTVTGHNFGPRYAEHGVAAARTGDTNDRGAGIAASMCLFVLWVPTAVCFWLVFLGTQGRVFDKHRSFSPKGCVFIVVFFCTTRWGGDVCSRQGRSGVSVGEQRPRDVGCLRRSPLQP